MSGVMEGKEEEDVIRNNVCKALSMELDDFSLQTGKKMEEYWLHVEQGENLKSISYQKLKILVEDCDETRSDSDYE